MPVETFRIPQHETENIDKLRGIISNPNLATPFVCRLFDGLSLNEAHYFSPEYTKIILENRYMLDLTVELNGSLKFLELQYEPIPLWKGLEITLTYCVDGVS